MLFTRRALLLASLYAPLARGQDRLTATDVVERIKENVGVDWAERTVDRIVAGRPEAPVKGIATTMMATLDVIQRAAKAGHNLVVSHEPTFYSHQDTVDDLKDDPTYQFKADFIRSNDVVVFHFHDHWHRRRPDGIAFGMARELGWDKYVDAEDQRFFRLPAVSLRELSRQVESKLGASTVRVLGDPNLEVRTVRASWGYNGAPQSLQNVADAKADVFILGETREWEAVEYAQDVIASGNKKGMIMIGHVASEQAGMKYCAEWLRTFISEVPIEFVPAAEPFWRP